MAKWFLSTKNTQQYSLSNCTETTIQNKGQYLHRRWNCNTHWIQIQTRMYIFSPESLPRIGFLFKILNVCLKISIFKTNKFWKTYFCLRKKNIQLQLPWYLNGSFDKFQLYANNIKCVVRQKESFYFIFWQL